MHCIKACGCHKAAMQPKNERCCCANTRSSTSTNTNIGLIYALYGKIVVFLKSQRWLLIVCFFNYNPSTQKTIQVVLLRVQIQAKTKCG